MSNLIEFIVSRVIAGAIGSYLAFLFIKILGAESPDPQPFVITFLLTVVFFAYIDFMGA